ncbi:MAG TPA: hypothetical protein VNJ54_02220 [Plantibacter sp.]|uniref:hypothetical protein n=1 Tax=Plantibacter sp. TaxID=1871045 RepID=UPI002C90DA78|nr:hypothetical protein [Plantibacter sp.]
MSTAQKQPHLLLISGNLSLLRGHYEGVLSALSAAGVRISIRYIKQKWLTVEEFTAMLQEAGVDADVRPLSRAPGDPDEFFGLRLRQLINVLRYLHADYSERTALSSRAFAGSPAGVQRWARRIRRLGRRPALATMRCLALLESMLPPSRAALATLDEERPDAVVATPVIRTPELVDFLKAAAWRGIPKATWIESWDNLTNKGLLHGDPDRVFVWNASQVRELTRYHRVPPERACVTGAQTFDHWFGDDPPSGRAEFCARLGIESDQPIILYLASSGQIAPNETEFFGRWLKTVRSSGDPLLRAAAVLVRPHPTVVAAWLEENFELEPGVGVSPSIRSDALNSDAFRQEYRDELHHSTLAVGINTSGLIDAAIFGKPVCTVELPELFDGQRGTVHFHHLADVESGVLRTAPSLDEHVAMLSEFVRRDPYARDERSTEFVRTFVRPHGLEVAPAQIFAEEMLRLCQAPSRASASGGPRRFARRLIGRLALVIGAPLEERPFERLLTHAAAGTIVSLVRLRHSLRGARARR